MSHPSDTLICENCGNTMKSHSFSLTPFCHHCALNPVIAELSGNDTVDLFIEGYSIEKEIGRGSMGAVYKARSFNPEREVAIKVLLDGRLAGKNEKERFEREVALLAKLEHPNIYPIYDAGESDGLLYYSTQLMEYQLADIIKETTLSEEMSSADRLAKQTKAAELVLDITKAISFAHKRGMIHRDIKPSNILFDAEDRIYLTDFGLALQYENIDDVRLTRSGWLAGSPAYMSPEQIDGASPTTQVDIYALGAVFFELVTGKPPFTETSLPKLVEAIKTSSPHFPSKKIIEKDLTAIILTCLAKNPAKRYHSAQSLADDLQRFIQREPISARPPSRWEAVGIWVKKHPLIVGLNIALIGFLTLLTLSLTKNLEINEQKGQLQADLLTQSSNNENAARKALSIETARKADRTTRDLGIESGLPIWEEALRLSSPYQEIHNSVLRSKSAWEKNQLKHFAHTDANTRFVVSPSKAIAIWQSDAKRCEFHNLLDTSEPPHFIQVDHPILDVSYALNDSVFCIVTESSIHLYDTKNQKLSKSLKVKLPSLSKSLLKHHPQVSKLKLRASSVGFTSPEGTPFIVAHYSKGAIIIWDTKHNTHVIKETIPALVGAYDSKMFVAGDKVISGLENSVFFILPDEEKIIRKVAPLESVISGTCSDKLNTAIFGLIDGNIIMVNTKEFAVSGRRLLDGQINSIKLQPESSTFLAASNDHHCITTKVTKYEGNPYHSFGPATRYPHPNAVLHSEWLAEDRFISFCEDGFYRIFLVGHEKPIHTFASENGVPKKILITKEKERMRMISLSPYSGLKMNWANDIQGRSLEENVRVRKMHYSHQEDSTLIFGERETPGIELFSVKGKQDSLEIKALPHLPSLSISPCGKYCSFSEKNGNIIAYNIKQKKQIFSQKTDPSPASITAIYQKENGEIEVVWCDQKALLNCYSLTHQKMVHTVQLNHNIEKIAVSPSSRRLAYSHAGYLSVLDIDTFQILPHFKKPLHKNRISSLAFSLDGLRLATGGKDHTARIWDLETGKQSGVDIPFYGNVNAVAFHPTEPILAIGGASNSIRLWDTTLHIQIGPDLPQEAFTAALTFNNNYELIIGLESNALSPAAKITHPSRGELKTQTLSF